MKLLTGSENHKVTNIKKLKGFGGRSVGTDSENRIVWKKDSDKQWELCPSEAICLSYKGNAPFPTLFVS